MTTFQDYLDKILKPSIINSIRRGNFDEIIDDPHLDVAYKDEEILKEIYLRRQEIERRKRFMRGLLS